MLFYWLLLAYFIAGAATNRESTSARHERTPVLLLAGGMVVWLAIGLRYQVGADWDNYRFLFSWAGYADFDRAMRIGDPAFQFINWSVQRLGGRFWMVNLLCASAFTWGLFRFARSQPAPWLCLVVAVPYLVVVVAMGYTRQAAAIGIVMAGIAALIRGGSIFRFALYVAAAALFHKTAVAVLPLAIFSAPRNRALNALAGLAGLLLLWDIFLADSVEGFVQNYVRTEYSSQGAAIRVSMNFVPAALLFLFRRRFPFNEQERKLWTYFGLVALVMPALLFIVPSSTAIDRISLYLIPLQLAVLPQLVHVFRSEAMGKTVVIAYSAAVLLIWLNFAAHAQYWVPYRIYPI